MFIKYFETTNKNTWEHLRNWEHLRVLTLFESTTNPLYSSSYRLERYVCGDEACAFHFLPIKDLDDNGADFRDQTDEALWQLWWLWAQPSHVRCPWALRGDMPPYPSASPCAQDKLEAVWSLWFGGAQPTHLRGLWEGEKDPKAVWSLWFAGTQSAHVPYEEKLHSFTRGEPRCYILGISIRLDS